MLVDPDGREHEPPTRPGQCEGDTWFDPETGTSYEWDGNGSWHSNMQASTPTLLNEAVVTPGAQSVAFNKSDEQARSYVESGLEGTSAFLSMADASAAIATTQKMTLAKRGVDAAAEAAELAKFGKVLSKGANGFSYFSAAYKFYSKTDNTSTFVDLGVTTAGIIVVGVCGTVAAPAVAFVGMAYGIWSVAGGSDLIDKNWGYRKPD
jgi:hypothetical protein